MSDALARIERVLQQALADLSAVANPRQLEAFRIRYLGSNGEIKNLMQLIKTAPADQKKAVGQRANSAKEQVAAAYESRKNELGKAAPSSWASM